MIISSPDKFFVPVILLKSYREVLDIEMNSNDINELVRSNDENKGNNINRKLLEDKILEYDINKFKNVSRKVLEDKVDDIKKLESDIYEDISNIGDEDLEYYILKYVNSFMIYENELEAEGCADINKEEYLKNIHSYVDNLKNLYNEFLNLKNSITVPLSVEDKEAIENHFVKKIEEIYNKQFTNIKCEEKNKVVDNNIQDIINETRQLIRKDIDEINQDILNNGKNKIVKDENYFKYQEKIMNEIEKEGK